MKNTIPSKNDSNDLAVKWGAATIFVAVLAGAVYTIYQTTQEVNQQTTTTTTSSTATPTATASIPPATSTPSKDDLAAQGTPAPATITSSTDLKSIDTSLDSSDIDSIISELAQNDSDLAAF